MIHQPTKLQNTRISPLFSGGFFLLLLLLLHFRKIFMYRIRIILFKTKDVKNLSTHYPTSLHTQLQYSTLQHFFLLQYVFIYWYTGNNVYGEYGVIEERQVFISDVLETQLRSFFFLLFSVTILFILCMVGAGLMHIYINVYH